MFKFLKLFSDYYLSEGSNAHSADSPQLERAVTAGTDDDNVLTSHTHLDISNALSMRIPRTVQHWAKIVLVRFNIGQREC